MDQSDVLYTKVIHQFSTKIVFQTIAANLRNRMPIWNDKQIVKTFYKISVAFGKSFSVVKSDVNSSIAVVDRDEITDIIIARINGRLH